MRPHELLAGVVAVRGGLHVVVDNAARTQATPVMQISAEEFDSVVGVNLSGTFNACQILGAHLADNRYGRIVNLGSLAGQNGGTATGAHYAASKGGIHTLTKVFARELAASGVTVNAVAPGPLDLPVVHSVVPPERMDSYLATIPVGRLGPPDFVAQVVALLASRDASSVTGACWDVHGGSTCADPDRRQVLPHVPRRLPNLPTAAPIARIHPVLGRQKLSV